LLEGCTENLQGMYIFFNIFVNPKETADAYATFLENIENKKM